MRLNFRFREGGEGAELPGEGGGCGCLMQACDWLQAGGGGAGAGGCGRHGNGTGSAGEWVGPGFPLAPGLGSAASHWSMARCHLPFPFLSVLGSVFLLAIACGCGASHWLTVLPRHLILEPMFLLASRPDFLLAASHGGGAAYWQMSRPHPPPPGRASYWL